MAQQLQRRVINSATEMNEFLSELKSQASMSIQETINAQMMVIRYVQSPTLIDTTFDSLIYSLKKSLRSAESKEMAIRIQEQFSIMIQNYVFFLDARMQYSLDEHTREGQQLLSEAGDILAASVINAAKLASGDCSSSDIDIVVQNIFSTNDLGEKSFFSRIVGWFIRDYNTNKKKVEFYKTLASLFEKLSKYQKIIGRSMLISEMIKRYIPNIIEYSEIGQEYKTYDAKKCEIKEDKHDFIFLAILGAISLVLWPIVLFIIFLFTLSNPEPFDYSSYSKMHWIVTVVIYLIYEISRWIKYWHILIKSNSCLSKMEKMDKSLEQIAIKFEDNDDDFMSMLR